MAFDGFNGAAPARARNVGNLASMPGVAFALQRGRARAGAEWRSMERAMAERDGCFNGAAPARARNVWRAGGKIVRSGFNGAAPARARNARTVAGHAATATASTGPRPRGRGMRRSIEQDRASWRLQRGRARAGAECNCPRAAKHRTPRFNGAAPARARNADWTNTYLASRATLQRGRARAGAECQCAAVTPASTGPRPRGRGCLARDVWPPEASTGPRPRGRGMDK